MSRFLTVLAFLTLFGVSRAIAADASASNGTTGSPTSSSDGASTVAGSMAGTDPNYRLSPGDTIGMGVFQETELSATQTISKNGEVRLPLIGEINVGGKSVREAEKLVENAYRDRQFLKDPVVTLMVLAYFPREVSVLGAVRSPGTLAFPRDVTSLDIVEVITRVGGFLPISKSDAVTVTHHTPDGKEVVTTVDLENVISGRRSSGKERANISIFPGDRIWVPERLF